MNAILHLGDCLGASGLRTIADRSIDHVICDPPYSDHVHRNLGTEERKDGGRRRGELSFAAITPAIADDLALELCRVARQWILIFCDEISIAMWAGAIRAVGGEYVRAGTWVKTDAMPQMSGDRPAAGTESIVIAHAPREKGSGRMKWNGGGRPATYSGPVRGGEERWHPTQKPEWLLERLIKDFTNPGDHILDPFTGSGTTAAIAVRTGRLFTGWEADAEFHRRASNRIIGSREQLELLKGA